MDCNQGKLFVCLNPGTRFGQSQTCLFIGKKHWINALKKEQAIKKAKNKTKKQLNSMLPENKYKNI